MSQYLNHMPLLPFPATGSLDPAMGSSSAHQRALQPSSRLDMLSLDQATSSDMPDLPVPAPLTDSTLDDSARSVASPGQELFRPTINPQLLIQSSSKDRYESNGSAREAASLKKDDLFFTMFASLYGDDEDSDDCSDTDSESDLVLRFSNRDGSGPPPSRRLGTAREEVMDGMDSDDESDLTSLTSSNPSVTSDDDCESTTSTERFMATPLHGSKTIRGKCTLPQVEYDPVRNISILRGRRDPSPQRRRAVKIRGQGGSSVRRRLTGGGKGKARAIVVESEDEDEDDDDDGKEEQEETHDDRDFESETDADDDGDDDRDDDWVPNSRPGPSKRKAVAADSEDEENVKRTAPKKKKAKANIAKEEGDDDGEWEPFEEEVHRYDNGEGEGSHSVQAEGSSSSAGPQKGKKREGKVPESCTRCRVNHRKCDGNLPCSKCHAAPGNCVYSREDQKRTTAVNKLKRIKAQKAKQE